MSIYSTTSKEVDRKSKESSSLLSELTTAVVDDSRVKRELEQVLGESHLSSIDDANALDLPNSFSGEEEVVRGKDVPIFKTFAKSVKKMDQPKRIRGEMIQQVSPQGKTEWVFAPYQYEEEDEDPSEDFGEDSLTMTKDRSSPSVELKTNLVDTGMEKAQPGLMKGHQSKKAGAQLLRDKLPGGSPDQTLPIGLSHQSNPSQLKETRPLSGLVGKEGPPVTTGKNQDVAGRTVQGFNSGGGPNDEERPNEDVIERGAKRAAWDELLFNDSSEDSGDEDDDDEDGELVERLVEEASKYLQAGQDAAGKELDATAEQLDPESLEMRKELIKDIYEVGTLARYFQTTVEERERLQMDPMLVLSLIANADFRDRMIQLQLNVENVGADDMSLKEVQALVEKVGEGMSGLMKRPIPGGLTANQVGDWMEFHGVLVKFLNREKLPAGWKTKFTKDMVTRTIEWYAQMKPVVSEMTNLQERIRTVMGAGTLLVTETFPLLEIAPRILTKKKEKVSSSPSLTTLTQSSRGGKGMTTPFTSMLPEAEEVEKDDFVMDTEEPVEGLAELGRQYRQRMAKTGDHSGGTSKESSGLLESSVSYYSAGQVKELFMDHVNFILEEMPSWGHTSVILDYLSKGVPTGELQAKSVSERQKMLKSGIKAMERVTPEVGANGYINVTEWWQKLVDQFETYSVPVKIRFKVLEETGGLKDSKKYEVFRQQMKELATTERMVEWINSKYPFTSPHDVPEQDVRWINWWAELGVKMMGEWYCPQDQLTVEENLLELFKSKMYKIPDNCAALNSDFYKIPLLYTNAEDFLSRRQSALKDTPGYLINKIREWLRTQGQGAIQMELYIQKTINTMFKDPEAVLPKNFVTPSMKKLIVEGGVNQIPSRVYSEMLGEMKRKAGKKEYDILLTPTGLQSIVESANKKAAPKKVNAVATLAGGRPSGKQDPTVGAATGGKEQKATICSTCNMFCGGLSGACLYFEKGQLSIPKFVSQVKNRSWSKASPVHKLRQKAWETLQHYYLKRNQIEDPKKIEMFKQALEAEAAKYTSGPDSQGWTPAKGNMKTTDQATARDTAGMVDWGKVLGSDEGLKNQLVNQISKEVDKQLTRDRSFGKKTKKTKSAAGNGGGGDSSSSSESESGSETAEDFSEMDC